MLIEYEGTNYHGFQIQNNVPTIQGELEKAIKRVTGEATRIHGAGRTDAGVHAKGQVAVFETESGFTPATFVRAINAYLPEDIAIRDASEEIKSFDPRRNANSREYRYTILNSPIRSPILRKWAYSVPKKLNIETMNTACEVLIGEHDCSPFTNKEGGTKNTFRTILKAEFCTEGDLIFFDMTAKAFLQQQVRRTVGSLIKVGAGRDELKEFYEIAGSGKIGQAKTVAPAHGLCLVKVNYSNIGFDYENI